MQPTAPVLPVASVAGEQHCIEIVGLLRSFRRALMELPRWPLAFARQRGGGCQKSETMPRLIISNIDYLVTVDPGRRIIRDGALVIQDGRIVGLGKSTEFPTHAGAEII